jgi:hypothetical protein
MNKILDYIEYNNYKIRKYLTIFSFISFIGCLTMCVVLSKEEINKYTIVDIDKKYHKAQTSGKTHHSAYESREFVLKSQKTGEYKEIQPCVNDFYSHNIGDTVCYKELVKDERLNMVLGTGIICFFIGLMLFFSLLIWDEYGY